MERFVPDLARMIDVIGTRWDSDQQVIGTTVVRFTIQRDGLIDEVAVDQGSGYSALELSATRAVRLTRQLPPLPEGFPFSSLTVHLTFQYEP